MPMVETLEQSVDVPHVRPDREKARIRFQRDRTPRHWSHDKSQHLSDDPSESRVSLKSSAGYVLDELTASSRGEKEDSNHTNQRLYAIGFDHADVTRIMLMYGRLMRKGNLPRGVLNNFHGNGTSEFMLSLEKHHPLPERFGLAPLKTADTQQARQYCFDLERVAQRTHNVVISDALTSRAYLIRKHVVGEKIEPNPLRLVYH
jgi:hypothetical protein